MATIRVRTATTTDDVVVRAVRANRGVQCWYQRQLQALVRDMANSMLLHIRVAYREAPAIGFAHDSTETLSRSLKKWGDAWTQKLDATSDTIANQFARKNRRHFDHAFKSALRDAGFTVRFAPTRGMVQAYKAVIAENVNLIRSIAPQFLKDVQSDVWASVMKGGAMAQLSRDIKKSYGVSWRRAALIARDQNNKARAVFEEQRRKELGITEAVWLHSAGGKVPRPTHVAMNNKRYKIAVGMYDSNVQKNVWPGTEINCRCVSKSVFPGRR